MWRLTGTTNSLRFGKTKSARVWVPAVNCNTLEVEKKSRQNTNCLNME